MTDGLIGFFAGRQRRRSRHRVHSFVLMVGRLAAASCGSLDRRIKAVSAVVRWRRTEVDRPAGRGNHRYEEFRGRA